MDGKVKELFTEEWTQLQQTWGTTKVREVQLMLALEESTNRPPTLLTKLLYILGLSGLTIAWTETGLHYQKVPEEVDDEDRVHKQSLTAALYEY